MAKLTGPSAVRGNRPGSRIYPTSPIGGSIEGIATGRDVEWEPLLDYRRNGVSETTIHGAVAWATGGKVVHVAPYTTSSIVSKSISKGHGRSTYRGLCKVYEGAHHARSNVECDALLINDTSRTDTYPYIEIEENDANVGHEASVSKIGEEQLFYLTSRGIPEEEAMAMIVRGFIEPIAKELPLEYAVELNRLIELEMEGSVG